MQILTLKDNHVVNVDGIAQVTLWNHVEPLFNWNTITPLFHQGNLAGSEFEIFNANKLYVAIELGFNRNGGMPVTGALADASVRVYNHANALVQRWFNLPLAFDTADANYAIPNDIEKVNQFFGRVVSDVYTQIKFNGYRLNI